MMSKLQLALGVLLFICSQPRSSSADGCSSVKLKSTHTPSTFTSPGFPLHYPPSTRQCWSITASDASQRVLLSIVSFRTEGCCDTLRIYDVDADGNREFSTQWSGAMYPRIVISTWSQFYLVWESNEDTQHEGFQIQYMSTEPHTEAGDCGFLSALSVASPLQSPGYPHNYQDGTTTCWIVINSSGGKSTALHFRFDHLDVEAGSTAHACDNDAITIHSGMSARRTNHVGSYCGQRAPGSITIHGNAAYIRFTTDAKFTRTGFVLAYSTDPLPEEDSRDMAIPGDCSHLRSYAFYNLQRLMSPNHPQNYPPNSDLCWVIEGSRPSDRVKLMIEELDLPGSDADCVLEDDYLEIRDGSSGQSLLQDRLCGSTTSDIITSSGPFMYVKFHSGPSFQALGFSAQYYSLTPENNTFHDTCTRYLATIEPRIFTSSDHPDGYTGCWVLKARHPSCTVRLRVLELELGSNSTCAENNYLEIIDGLPSAGEVLGLWCKSERQVKVTTVGPHAHIMFHTTGRYQNAGFSIEFSEHQVLIPNTVGVPRSPIYHIINVHGSTRIPGHVVTPTHSDTVFDGVDAPNTGVTRAPVTGDSVTRVEVASMVALVATILILILLAVICFLVHVKRGMNTEKKQDTELTNIGKVLGSLGVITTVSNSTALSRKHSLDTTGSIKSTKSSISKASTSGEDTTNFSEIDLKQGMETEKREIVKDKLPPTESRDGSDLAVSMVSDGKVMGQALQSTRASFSSGSSSSSPGTNLVEPRRKSSSKSTFPNTGSRALPRRSKRSSMPSIFGYSGPPSPFIPPTTASLPAYSQAQDDHPPPSYSTRSSYKT